MEERFKRRKMRAAIAERFSGDAAPSPRFLVAVNFALKAACRGNPPDLLRYGSSSQKVLRYFLGALFFVFGLFARWGMRLARRPRAQRAGDGAASAAPSALPPTCL